MATLDLIAAIKTITRTSENTGYKARGTRDGLLFTAEEMMAYGLEGRVLNASAGTQNTPVTISILTASYLVTTPQFEIDVPTGTTIIPIAHQIICEAETGTINKFFALTGTSLFGVGTSTPATPRSTRSDTPYASLCTVNTLYTGAGTTPANPMEYWRSSAPLAFAVGAFNDYQWHYQQAAPVVIVGPGSVALYGVSTGSAATGYIKMQWIEIPTSSVS